MKAVEHAKSSEMVHLRVLCSNIFDVVKLEFNVPEILKSSEAWKKNRSSTILRSIVYLEQCFLFFVVTFVLFGEVIANSIYSSMITHYSRSSRSGFTINLLLPEKSKSFTCLLALGV